MQNIKQQLKTQKFSSRRRGNAKVFHFLFPFFHLAERKRIAGFAALIAAVIVSTISLVILGSFLTMSIGSKNIIRKKISSLQSYYIAESGVEDGILRIRKAMQYQAVNSFSVGSGTATVNISGSGNLKTIFSQGELNGIFKSAQSELDINSDSVEFTYGAQVGAGGLVMEPNSRVEGSVYSNGPIAGDNGAQITGDAYAAVGAAATPDASYVVYDSDYEFGLKINGDKRIDIAQSFEVSNEDDVTQVSLYLKKVNSPSDASVKIIKDKDGKPSKKQKDVKASGTLSAASVGSNYAWIDIALSQNPELDDNKPYWIVIDTVRDDNNYWVWGYDSGSGYPDGEAKYSDDWTDENWTDISGDMNFKIWLSAAAINGISDVTIDGDAYANTISGSAIGGNANGDSLLNSTVSGNADFNSMSNCAISGNAEFNTQTGCSISGSQTTPNLSVPTDPSPLNMPISQANIDEWKQEAAAGGVINGDYSPPSGESTSLGPKQINGDLDLTNNQTLVVTGTIYVTGSVDLDNNSTIVLDSSYQNRSGVVLADNLVHVKNNGQLAGSGQSGSYLMMVALASGGGHHNSAIDLHNNSSGAIFYAPNGLIYLHNGVQVTELVGYKLQLSQNAVLQYEIGLQNIQFSAGATASYQIKNWKEVE